MARSRHMLTLAGLAGVLAVPLAWATGIKNPCPNDCCPPPYLHCSEAPPKIKVRDRCPRPICDPCQLPHAGYWQTCWQPWPYPPDWSHCRVVPPGARIPPPLPPVMSSLPIGPSARTPMPVTRPDPGLQELPSPRPAPPRPESPEGPMSYSTPGYGPAPVFTAGVPVAPTRPSVTIRPSTADAPAVLVPQTAPLAGVPLPPLGASPTAFVPPAQFVPQSSARPSVRIIE